MQLKGLSAMAPLAARRRIQEELRSIAATSHGQKKAIFNHHPQRDVKNRTNITLLTVLSITLELSTHSSLRASILPTPSPHCNELSLK